MRLAVTKSDLTDLNSAYWDVKTKGEAWDSCALSLSRIYYACEAVVDNQDVVTDCSYDAIHGYADLNEYDTTKGDE